MDRRKLAHLIQDAMDDLGVSYDALPGDEVADDVAGKVKEAYKEIEEDAWKYKELSK